MESSPEDDNINNKYIILEGKGYGTTAYVYLVEDKKDKKLYAAKVFEFISSFFEKEIEIMKKVSSLYNPFIINLIEYGEGPVKAPSKPKINRKYEILEYASKGILFDYISCPEKGFSERHAKLIFHKILKGVQAFHKAGICHRDIKMENILVDDKYDPKICDFGFGSEIKGNDGSGKLTEFYGSEHYMAPEIIYKRSYEGVKVDIFSLGVVLFSLVNNIFGFEEARCTNKYYKFIVKKKDNLFWEKVIEYYSNKSEEVKNSLLQLTKEFKELYVKMISYNPDLRPSIDDILKDPWMKEVTSLNDKEYNELEKEVYKEFQKREVDVFKNNETINTQNNDGIKICNGNDKGISDDKDEVEYFDLILTPKYIQKSSLIMNNFIKINGNLRPSVFMNSLANKIVKELENVEKIEQSMKNLKFNVIFEEPLEDEEEIDEELKKEMEKISLENTEELKEAIPPKNCVIQIKLFQCINGGYLIRFMKKKGEIEEYHKYFKSIKSIVKEIL